MEFEWDPKKAYKNEIKHGTTFQDAATVFGDPLAITFADPDHSEKEQRYLTLGMSRMNHSIVISHTDREGKIRIISARFMTRKERRMYEKD